MKTFAPRTSTKAMLVAAAAVSVTLVTATTANAASVSTTYGHTSANWNGSKTYSGTVYDDSADGYCVRVYGAGYNIVLGWGSGNYRGQACGKGDHTGWSESPTTYSDNYAVSLCRGMPNSSRSNCTPYYKVH
jgi:hypothetical protein